MWLCTKRCAGRAILAAGLIAASPVAAHAEQTVIRCSGSARGYDRATHRKLPAAVATRTFAFDDATHTISERLGDRWTVLDTSAIVDPTYISARYTRDYPDGRIDVIFEFSRTNDLLFYLVDIDERPGELFAGQCDVSPGKPD